LLEELSRLTAAAVNVLHERRMLLGLLSARPGRPLHAALADERLDAANGRFGVYLAGLSEALQLLDVGTDALSTEAARVCGHLQAALQDCGREHRLSVLLRGDSIAPLAIVRMARLDVDQYPECRQTMHEGPDGLWCTYSSGLQLPSTEALAVPGQLSFWPEMEGSLTRRHAGQVHRLRAEASLHQFDALAESPLYLLPDECRAEPLAHLLQSLSHARLSGVRLVTRFVVCARCGNREEGAPQVCCRCGGETRAPEGRADVEQLGRSA
jgi:hypothetical protein